MIKNPRIILVAWISTLLFMGIAFYMLLTSPVPIGAKIIFTVLPLVVWMLGGLALYSEYHSGREESRRESEILEEAKRILNSDEVKMGSSRRGSKSDADNSREEDRD